MPALIGIMSNLKEEQLTKEGEETRIFWVITLGQKKPTTISVWEAALMKGVKLGQKLKVDYVEKGEYKNATAIEIVEDVAGATKEAPKPAVKEAPKETPKVTKDFSDIVKPEVKEEKKVEPKQQFKQADAVVVEPKRVHNEKIKPSDGNYFADLMKLEGEVAKKGPQKLNYISWANSWAELKKQHYDASYTVYCNADGMPHFIDKTGGFAKVGVTVKGIEHISMLPIMDYSNKAVKAENITTFDTNKAIQRAMTKAIAMHGFGLYVYQGEDMPEE